MAMGSGKAIRNMAHDLLNKHECEILKAALKHFRATKSVPFLCTSLMQVINTPQKMVLLEEISNMLPESLRGDFTNICSMNFKDYTKEDGEDKKVIAQDATGQYMVVESDHRKDLIKPGDNPDNNFGKSNVTGVDLRLQAPPKPKKGSESGSTDTLQDENQNQNHNAEKDIDKQKQRLTLPLKGEDGTHTPSSVGTCRTEDLNDYVDKHLGVIYEREFETSPLPGEVTSSTDIGEMYGLQKKDSSLPRKKKVTRKEGEGAGEKGAKAKGRKMSRQDSGDSSTTGASKPLSRPQSRGSQSHVSAGGHSTKALKKKASKMSLDSRESLDSRDQYLMEVQSKNDDNVVGTIEMNSFSPMRVRKVIDQLPHEASDKSIQVLLDPRDDPRNLRCESTQTSPSISRENSMHQLPVGKGRRKARSAQTHKGEKGERAASAPPGEKLENGAKVPKKVKDKSNPNHSKSGSRPPSSTMTRSSSLAHSLGGRNVEIRKVKLARQETSDLGFSIRGGRDVRSGVYISEIDSNSQAEKQGLQVGDRILKVNDVSFRAITHDEAAYTIKTAGRIVMFVTSSLIHKMPTRSAPPSMKGARAVENLKSMTVKADPDGWLGCSIRGGTDYGMNPMVSNVDPGSPAEKVGLKNGDLVVRMNGVDVTSLTHMQIVTLATSSRELRLLIKPIEQPQQQDEAREPLEDLSAHESTPTPTFQNQGTSPSPVAREAPVPDQLPMPEKTDTGKSPRGKRKQKKSDKKYASTDAINHHHHEHPDLAIAKNDENEPPAIRLVNATPLIDGKSEAKPTEEGGSAKNKDHEEERKKEKRKSRSRQNLALDEKGDKGSTQGDKVKKRDRLKVDGDGDEKTRSLDRRKLRKEREEKKAKRDGTKSLDRKEMEQISKDMKDEQIEEKKKKRKEHADDRKHESREEKRRERKEEKEKIAEEIKLKEAAVIAKEAKAKHEAKNAEKHSNDETEHRRKKSAEWSRTESFEEALPQDEGPSDRSTPIMKQVEHPEETEEQSPVARRVSPQEQKKSSPSREQNDAIQAQNQDSIHKVERKTHFDKKSSVENEPVLSPEKEDHKKGRKEQKHVEKHAETSHEKVTRNESREEKFEDLPHREKEVHQNGQHVVQNGESSHKNHHNQKHHEKKKAKHDKHSEKVHHEKSQEKAHLEDEKPAERIKKDLSPVKPRQPIEVKEEEIQMSVASEVANGNSGGPHHRGKKERQASKEERESRRKKTPTSEVDSGLPPSMEDLADDRDPHKLIRRMTQEDSWSDNNASFDREDFDPGSLNRKRRTSVSSQTTQSTQTDISGEIKVTKVMSGTIRMNLDQQGDDPARMVLSPKDHVKNIFPMHSSSDHLHHDEGAQTYMYGSIEGINDANPDSASLEDAPHRSTRHAPYKKLSRAGSDASLMKKKQHGISLKHKAPSVSNLMLESSPGVRQRPSRYDNYNMEYPPQIRDLRLLDYYEPRVRSLPRGMPGIDRHDGMHTLPRNYSFTRGLPDDYEERYYMKRDPHSEYSVSSTKEHGNVRTKLPRDIHSEYSIRTAREEYEPDRDQAWYDDSLESNWRIPLDKEKNVSHAADLRGYESDHMIRHGRERDDSGSRSVAGDRVEGRRYCDRDFEPVRGRYYSEKEYRRWFPEQEYSRRPYLERDNSHERRYLDKYYDRDLPMKEFIDKPREYKEKRQEREADRSREQEGDKTLDRDIEKDREKDFEKREREFFEYNREQELKKKGEQKLIEKGRDRDNLGKRHEREYKDHKQERRFHETRGEDDHLDKTREQDYHEYSREKGYTEQSYDPYGEKNRDRNPYSDRDRPHSYGPPGYRWNPEHNAPYDKRAEYGRRDSLPRESQYDRPYMGQARRRERSFDLGLERERSFGAMSFGGYEHEDRREREYSGSQAYRPGYGERPLANRPEPGYPPPEKVIPGRQGIYLPDPEQARPPGPSAARPYLDPTFLRQPQRLAPPFNTEQTSLSRESLDHDTDNEHVDPRVNMSSPFGVEHSQSQPTKEKPTLYQQTVGSLEGQGIRIQWKKPPRELEQFALKGGPLPWHSQQQYSQDSDTSSEKLRNLSYGYSSFSEPKSAVKRFDSSSPISTEREEFQNSSDLSFTQNPLDFHSGPSGVNRLSGFHVSRAEQNVLNDEKPGNNLGRNDTFLSNTDNDFVVKNNKDIRYPMDEFDTLGDETDQMTISSLPPDDHCEDGSEQETGLPPGGDGKKPVELEEHIVVENSVGLSCEPSMNLDAPLEDLRPAKTSPSSRPPHMRQTSEEEEWNM
ncbi:trichohyalin-like isoform X2 [Lineus longissimus]|uniref:trichohyalin-like isoform X2 n=1 Tax=Lineus longissimus TaxID=88925 RepID=UPI002B4D0A31